MSWISGGRSLLFVIGLASAGAAALAQDFVATAPAGKRVLLDNPHVRVVETTLAPRAKEPVHTHPANFAYLFDAGRVRVSYLGGETEELDGGVGDVLWSDAEGPHTLENLTDRPLRFLVVELKDLPYRPASAPR